MSPTAKLQSLRRATNNQLNKVLAFSSRADGSAEAREQVSADQALVCHICGANKSKAGRFFDDQSLGAHMWRSHKIMQCERAKVRNKQCPACLEVFANRHVAAHHYQFKQCAESRAEAASLLAAEVGPVQ